jgi:plastocyanin
MPVTALALLTVLVAAGACGGSLPAPSGGGDGGADGPTITITASGVSPKTLTVMRGTQVTFVNSDTRTHEMNSDPHPTHGGCPEIDAVGFLSPGQRKQTGNLNAVRNCGYHDHNQPTNSGLQGTISIQ